MLSQVILNILYVLFWRSFPPIYEIAIVLIVGLDIVLDWRQWHMFSLFIFKDEDDGEHEDDNLLSVSSGSAYYFLVGVYQDTVFCHEFRNKAIFIGKCPAEGG